MDIICPSCQTVMEVGTDPGGGLRRLYFCPSCEGEYRMAEPKPAPPPNNGESDSGDQPGNTTQPGFTVAGIPGGEWQIPEELRFSVKVLEGTESGKVFEVTKSRFTVGREEGEILLGDPQVSRKHAAFEIYGSHHIVLKDLASTNGTYLNGRLIAYSKLNHGDKIRVGSTVLEANIEIAG